MYNNKNEIDFHVRHGVRVDQPMGARCPRFASFSWTLTWPEKDLGGRPSLDCLSAGTGRVALQGDDLQSADHLEVAKVCGSHAVAEFQSGHPDQQIG